MVQHSIKDMASTKKLSKGMNQVVVTIIFYHFIVMFVVQTIECGIGIMVCARYVLEKGLMQCLTQTPGNISTKIGNSPQQQDK